jgi:hypothetical protein
MQKTITKTKNNKKELQKNNSEYGKNNIYKCSAI